MKTPVEPPYCDDATSRRVKREKKSKAANNNNNNNNNNNKKKGLVLGGQQQKSGAAVRPAQGTSEQASAPHARSQRLRPMKRKKVSHWGSKDGTLASHVRRAANEVSEDIKKPERLPPRKLVTNTIIKPEKKIDEDSEPFPPEYGDDDDTDYEYDSSEGMDTGYWDDDDDETEEREPEKMNEHIELNMKKFRFIGTALT